MKKLTERVEVMEQEMKRFAEDARIQDTRLAHAEQKCRMLSRESELKLRSAKAQHESNLSDLENQHSSALQKKTDEIALLSVKVLDLETRLKDDVASLTKRHQNELKSVVDSLKARHSTEITDVDYKLHGEIENKDDKIYSVSANSYFSSCTLL
jgi:hypothetical protein